MTEDKMRRMVTGGVVAATMLIVTLLSIHVYNIVTICVQNNRMAELAAEEARLERLTQETNDAIANYQLDQEKFYLAWTHGYRPAEK